MKSDEIQISQDGGNIQGGEKVSLSVMGRDGLCLGEVLIGLNEQDELCVVVTPSGKDGENHPVAVYPQYQLPDVAEESEHLRNARELVKQIASNDAVDSYTDALACSCDSMLRDDAMGQVTALVRVANEPEWIVIDVSVMQVADFDRYEMVVFDGGNSSGDSWKHTFFPPSRQHIFVDEVDYFARSQPESVSLPEPVNAVEFVCNRRPFSMTSDGMLVNGRICFEVSVAEAFTDAQRQEAEDATNNRFEQFLAQSESFAPLDETRYSVLVDTFIDIVIRSCCTSR